MKSGYEEKLGRKAKTPPTASSSDVSETVHSCEQMPHAARRKQVKIDCSDTNSKKPPPTPRHLDSLLASTTNDADGTDEAVPTSVLPLDDNSDDDDHHASELFNQPMTNSNHLVR